MLCLAIRPPETPVLGMLKYSRNLPFKILGGKPGNRRLLPKPGLLPLRETPCLPHDVSNRQLERQHSPEMADKLTISDRLESGKGGREFLAQQRRHLVQPARFQHPGHSASDSIVSDATV